MAPTNVLVAGATGFIGGTLLDHFTKCDEFKDFKFSVLVRDDARAKSFAEDGLGVYTMKDLDDSAAVTKAASENDIVVGAVSGFHTSAAKALVEGLAQRKQKTGRDVYYIHTDGTSNFGDKPVSGAFTIDRTFSDKDADIYDYLKQREADEPYAQRTTSLAAIDDSEAKGVLTTVIGSPTIYGVGSGKFNRLSVQYPFQMRAALKLGLAEYVGDGAGEWGFVHVQDLADLYALALRDFVSGERRFPTGRAGFVFSETGPFTWKEVAENIARGAVEVGALKECGVQSIGLREAADKWLGGDVQLTELGFGSNARTKAELGKEFGWKPTRTRKDWEQSFGDEISEILKEDEGKGSRIPSRESA